MDKSLLYCFLTHGVYYYYYLYYLFLILSWVHVNCQRNKFHIKLSVE